jgi:predicted nucleotidyltransferase
MSTARGNDGVASGRFVLRIDPELHVALRRAAHQQGLSLNAYINDQLSTRPASSVPGAAASCIQRAQDLFGSHLIGLAVFGSWARGDASDRSDVDLLVVVGPAVHLTRGLYREWDARPMRWAGRSVEPHIVHLPAADAAPGGLWAEVALDGIVIYELEFELSRYLIRARSSILAGRMSRRAVHGQPFWVEATVDEES